MQGEVFSSKRASPLQLMEDSLRIFLAALMLANKYLEDHCISVFGWSQLSGFQISEINKVEMICLQALDWRLHISVEDFEQWGTSLLGVDN